MGKAVTVILTRLRNHTTIPQNTHIFQWPPVPDNADRWLSLHYKTRAMVPAPNSSVFGRDGLCVCSAFSCRVRIEAFVIVIAVHEPVPLA